MENLLYGFSIALTYENLLFCFIGVFLGTFLGVLPGIGALASVSMLLPLTFYLEPTTGIIMLAGVYYGSEYGGSTASILLNLPGTPSNAVTCLDGYPMAKQGRAGIALFIATVASFIGGSFGILLLIFLTPFMLWLTLGLGSPEYFALMLLGLVAAGTIGGGSPVKGLIMVVVGLMLGGVGTDMATGVPRYTFGFLELTDGIALGVIAMGLFGVSEVIASINATQPLPTAKISLRSMVPTREDWRRSFSPILRGTGIGSIFGTMPGTGSTLAAFVSYAVVKKMSRDPSRFGKGAIEGVAAPEAANNAASQTAFIPTLGLGIPGSPTMAIMLGALIIHGIDPGPGMINRHPDLFWGVVASFWIGNVLLVILNIPLIGLWTAFLRIPYRYLYPGILILVCIGVFTLANNVFDVWMVLITGVVGYGLRIYNFSPAPLLMGFVLGPLMEQNLVRSMMLVNGDVLLILQRPATAGILLVTLLILLAIVTPAFRSLRKRPVLD